MLGGVTRHMLPRLPEGPPPPCKQALTYLISEVKAHLNSLINSITSQINWEKR